MDKNSIRIHLQDINFELLSIIGYEESERLKEKVEAFVNDNDFEAKFLQAYHYPKRQKTYHLEFKKQLIQKQLDSLKDGTYKYDCEKSEEESKIDKQLKEIWNAVPQYSKEERDKYDTAIYNLTLDLLDSLDYKYEV